MSLTTENTVKEKFAFSSSVAGDVWHSGKDAKAYEWWYFDAISDDGRDAIVVVFLDNFIYSSAYNREAPNGSARNTPRSPAIAFTYFRDGRPRYRTVLEFPESEFSASTSEPDVRIGRSSFKYRSASYGSGYFVEIDVPLPGERRLTAVFEWLSVEADLRPETCEMPSNSHCWNMAVPRSDVSGRINVFNRKGIESESANFRGTGYHDHKLDNRWLAKTVRDWHWGRAHFADATAVFYRYREAGDEDAPTKLLIAKDGALAEHSASFRESAFVRDRYGLRHSKRITLGAGDGLQLEVRPVKTISSSFFYLRFLSEMSLTTADGERRETVGITEFLKPSVLTHRWMALLGDLRTGRNGKGPLLP